MVAIPPPRPELDPPNRRLSFATGLVIGLVIAGLLGAVIYLLATRSSDSASLSASPSTSTTTTPSPTKSPPPPLVKEMFLSQQPAVGERISLRVKAIPHPYDCTRNTYTANGDAPKTAYLTKCNFLESQGYEVILFAVILKNQTGRAIDYSLRHFVLTAKHGYTYGPVNITSLEGLANANYIHETGHLPPHAKVDGWITFDARLGRDLVASRLSYIESPQTITIVFDGHHNIE